MSHEERDSLKRAAVREELTRRIWEHAAGRLTLAGARIRAMRELEERQS